MKAWAVLLPFLCINSRRLERSLKDAVAPSGGYLPSQDYEYDQDLRGYSAAQKDLAGYSSAENELPPESEDSDSAESCQTWQDCSAECPQDVGCICKNGKCKISSGCGTMGAIFRTACSSCSEDGCEDEGACKWINGQCLSGSKQQTKEPEDEMDISTLKAQEKHDLGNSDTKDEEEDLISSDSDNGDDEATTKQPNNETSENMDDDIEGSGTSELIETGYGSPVDENGTLNVEEDEAVVTDNIDRENDAPPSKTDDLIDATRDEEDSDILPKTVNNEDANRNEESPQEISETPDDKDKDANQPKLSDINSSIKICPGGSMTVCVSVCPGTSATIYGACVQGCAQRCEGQDPR